MEMYQGYFFWGFLIVYGIIMLAVSPRARTLGSFFKGEDNEGNPPSVMMLSSSIFISWIFAKSVTNCANLGAQYGILGGIAYAVYWLTIPFVGVIFYRLRTKYKATGLVSFLSSNYGQAAAFAFSLAILIRLFNEVWSNSSVIGGYYGESGSTAFAAAAILFTVITLIYSCRGGLRSSIFTDFLQTIIFVVLLLIILFMVVPRHSVSEYVTSSTFSMSTGVDYLLVALIQCFSYGFHDPVLTDRGFICEEKHMLKSFFIGGLLGFVAIVLFSLIGVSYMLDGNAYASAGGNVPAAYGQILSFGAFLVMSLLMIASAGSTLDSTFASMAKLTAYDCPRILGKDLGEKARWIGIGVMIFFALVGNLPMLNGTSILAATTISGTMVMGLAPIFVLHGFVKPTKVGFHLSFWIGIFMGVATSFFSGIFPQWMYIGDGSSALSLGVNLYGLILCTICYVVPGLISGAMARGKKAEAKA